LFDSLIDIHSHILPAVDDGAKDLNEALQMARIAVAAGTTTMVASPHVYDEQSDPLLFADRVAALNRALQEQAIGLEVVPGAEAVFHLGRDVLARYCINGSRYLLLEFPHSHLPRDAGRVIFELVSAGLHPIIAHPERNPSIIREPQLLFDLVDQGALVQLTADSVSGGHGSSVQSCSRYLLKQKVVHFLASDAHSTKVRTPSLKPGLKAAAKLIGHEQAAKLVKDNPRCVITGQAWA